MTYPALKTTGLGKRFGDKEILSGINLSVRQGECVCVLGPSGSGKSTLLRCLAWLSPPTSGYVWIGGELIGIRETSGGDLVPLSERLLQEQRQRIGMVFQSFNLWPHRTAAENVMEGLVVVKKMPRRDAREQADELLRRVGLADRADYHPARLSGGQQQRVAIARAIAMKPEVLLFDEPTSALDPELVGEVLAVMGELAAGDTTMIIVTHEIGFAVDVADRMILMDSGRIIEEAPPRQLLHAPQQERSRAFLQQALQRHASFAIPTH
jgi:polar amino acid transport system ATP-binding protein